MEFVCFVVPVDIPPMFALRRGDPSCKESYPISVNSIPKYGKEGSRMNTTSLLIEGGDYVFLTSFLISAN
jgi:hypothetical protein